MERGTIPPARKLALIGLGIFAGAVLSALAGALANGVLGWFGGIATSDDVRKMKQRMEVLEARVHLIDFENPRDATTTIADRVATVEDRSSMCIERVGVEIRARAGLQAAFEFTLDPRRRSAAERAAGRAWNKWEELSLRMPPHDVADRAINYARTFPNGER